MSSNLRLRSLLVMGASVTALTALASPALAQSSGGNVIEELVVTAQRREQALQDVPVAVSAFSQDALKAQRLDGGGNLVLSVPNVNFTRGNFGGYSFSIRGIGSKVVGAGGTAGVSFHQNNSPLSANRLADAAEILVRNAGDGPVSALAWDGTGARLMFGLESGAAGLLSLPA